MTEEQIALRVRFQRVWTIEVTKGEQPAVENSGEQALASLRICFEDGSSLFCRDAFFYPIQNDSE